jgi:hypothetical protein
MATAAGISVLSILFGLIVIDTRDSCPCDWRIDAGTMFSGWRTEVTPDLKSYQYYCPDLVLFSPVIGWYVNMPSSQ